MITSSISTLMLYTPVIETLIHREIKDVTGPTPFDFRQATLLGDHITANKGGLITIMVIENLLQV